MEAVDFYVKDTTPAHLPVAGVVVKVTSQDGATIYGQAVTDAAGHAGFLLDSGVTYQGRFFKFSVGFTNPQLFTVLPTPAVNTFDIAAALITPPVPTDARLCTAYGFFRDPTGAAQEGVDIHFIAKFDPVWLEGAAVVKERVIIRTNEKGYAQVNLIRNGQYDVTIQGEEDITRHISVPDAPNVNLPDLLFPIVSQVVLTPPGPYVVASGAQLEVAMQVLASDGEDLGNGYGDVLLSVDLPDVLSWSFTPTGIVFIGLSPGTAQLSLRRTDKSIVHIPDGGIVGSPIAVVVT